MKLRPTVPPRVAIVLTSLALLAMSALAAPAASWAAPRASLTDVENDVMCVSCHEPLAVAQSPQAYAERNYIRTLIAQGKTKPQIERALVAQYGPAVLGRPPAQGFDLAIYVLPPAVVLLGLAVLAVTLPRWRRRGRSAAAPSPAGPAAPDPAEAARLQEQLARFT